MKIVALTFLILISFEAGAQKAKPKTALRATTSTTTTTTSLITSASVTTTTQQEEYASPEEELIAKNTLDEEDEYRKPKEGDPNTKASKSAKIQVSEEKLPGGPPPKVEIIVDSSGSMGQLLGGNKTKMYYAKKLLSRYLIDQWREKAEVGMRVYGSRRRNDCEDNFLSTKFHERTIDEIERKVSGMLPRGRTPIADSLMAAFNDLKSYKGPKRIVLFTDGEETCGGDPCKLAKEAEKNKNVDIKIYVVAIGFDPKDKGIEKVKCIGDLHTANNDEDLFNALGGISNSIHSKSNNLIVKSPKIDAEVMLYEIKDGKREFVRMFTAAWGTKVPPGVYEAEVALQPYFKFPRFTIPPGRKVTLFVEGKGQVKVNYMQNLLDVELLDKYNRVVHKFRSDIPFLAEAGKYKLHVFRPPFFESMQPTFYVYPQGDHQYEAGDASAVVFDYPEITGLYIYDGNDRLMGNYVTNSPFVLKNGTYRMYVDQDCFLKNVNVAYDGNVKHVDCSKEPKP